MVTRDEFLDIQDELFGDHPDELDGLYIRLKGITKKEPEPAMVVNKFKDNYPELYQSTMDRAVAQGIILVSV